MTQENTLYHTGTEAEPYSDLLDGLAAEEAALDDLLFKLREQFFVLSSGEHRWLDRTTAEVNTALERLRDAGSRREAAARSIHSRLGLPEATTLGALADQVPDEATGQRIRQRRQSLRNALDMVRRTSRKNSELLASSLASTGDALAVLGMTPTYDASGVSGRFPALSRVLDTRA